MFKNATSLLSKISETYFNSATLIKRNAGHSKWSNIKHTKGAKDAIRSQLFTKLARQMKVAVQEGGSIDPKVNLRLEQIIEQAKRANMPSATLQSVLKSCQNDKSDSKPYLLEIKGPGSCFILCEVFTNQLHHLRQTMATILRKHQSKFSDGGGINLFVEKGIIEAEISPENKTEDEILEKATDDAIESNAEEVRLIETNILQFICGKTNFKAVVENLQKLNYNIVSAAVEFIPLKEQTLQESDIKICENLFEKLENLPEVVRLSDNIAV